jgi:hypothetical protein
MENNNDEQYNNVPAQQTRNAISVSGFSWAQVAATKPATSRTPSHVSELTNPTQATQSIAQQTEITELKTEVTEMRGQLKRFEDLIILLTSRLPAATPEGYQQQQMQQNQNHQQLQQWPQQFPPPQQTYLPPPQYPPTPTRNNGCRQDPRGPPIHDNRIRQELPPPRKLLQNNIDETQERPSKRADDKTTPSKRGLDQHEQPGDRSERRIVNPYAQPRHRLPHPTNHMNHHPSQYAHNQMSSSGDYYDGRHDALIYSQQPGQFRYTPPSQEYEDNNYQGQESDTAMQDQMQEQESHPAEDARNYAQL